MSTARKKIEWAFLAHVYTQIPSSATKEVKVKVEVRVTWTSHFTVELPHECVYIIVYFFI